jgi:DNA-binding HxlR family transcriptional regulator
MYDRKMSGRTYGDACGIARALDLIGDRWALLVVRELVLGPKRYTDLVSGLGRVAPDVLAQRLRDLEAGGLARRTRAPGPGRARVYELTDRGHELEPVLRELGRFGSSLAMPAGELVFSPDAAAIALRTTFDPQRAGGLRTTCRLTLDGEPFVVRIDSGQLDLGRGGGGTPETSLTTTPGTLAEILWHGRTLGDAVRAGDAEFAGDARVLESMFDAFRR